MQACETGIKAVGDAVGTTDALAALTIAISVKLPSQAGAPHNGPTAHFVRVPIGLDDIDLQAQAQAQHRGEDRSCGEGPQEPQRHPVSLARARCDFPDVSRATTQRIFEYI